MIICGWMFVDLGGSGGINVDGWSAREGEERVREGDVLHLVSNRL